MNLLVYVAIVAAIFSSGFGSAWKLQSLRAEAKEKEYVEAAYENEVKARKMVEHNAREAQRVQTDARAREQAARLAADGARAALVGLSDAANASLRAAGASHEACLVSATTSTDILKQSTDRYRDLAETCDRHVSDLRTLMASP